MSDYALLSNTSYCAGCTYGKEVEEGARSAADELGMETLLHGTHKTKGTEIAGVVISIKNADCDMLLLGTAVKDTITLYATLRKLGWKKTSSVTRCCLRRASAKPWSRSMAMWIPSAGRRSLSVRPSIPVAIAFVLPSSTGKALRRRYSADGMA